MKIRTCFVLALFLAPLAILAADNSMEALRERFKSRLPQIQKFKAEGVVGETAKGTVDFVSDKKADAEQLVKDENADRETLYKALADKEGVSPQKVAERNAKRNFERAKPGEYLQEPDGKWRKKA